MKYVLPTITALAVLLTVGVMTSQQEAEAIDFPKIPTIQEIAREIDHVLSPHFRDLGNNIIADNKFIIDEQSEIFVETVEESTDEIIASIDFNSDLMVSISDKIDDQDQTIAALQNELTEIKTLLEKGKPEHPGIGDTECDNPACKP
jgi:hypothetical protein